MINKRVPVGFEFITYGSVSLAISAMSQGPVVIVTNQWSFISDNFSGYSNLKKDKKYLKNICLVSQYYFRQPHANESIIPNNDMDILFPINSSTSPTARESKQFLKTKKSNQGLPQVWERNFGIPKHFESSSKSIKFQKN